MPAPAAAARTRTASTTHRLLGRLRMIPSSPLKYPPRRDGHVTVILPLKVQVDELGQGRRLHKALFSPQPRKRLAGSLLRLEAAALHPPRAATEPDSSGNTCPCWVMSVTSHLFWETMLGSTRLDG